MRAPSVKRLMSEMKLDSKQANLIRKLAKACGNAHNLRELIATKCPNTHAYATRCYNDPFDSQMWRVTMALHAMNDICDTHGVEALTPDSWSTTAPPYEYLNTGDTYATTLLYKRATDTLSLGCWGDVAEKIR